jgi:hypothetical protein
VRLWDVWFISGSRKVISAAYIRDDGEFATGRADDPNNTLYMHYSNLDVLSECCREARDIEIPAEAIEAAKAAV